MSSYRDSRLRPVRRGCSHERMIAVYDGDGDMRGLAIVTGKPI